MRLISDMRPGKSATREITAYLGSILCSEYVVRKNKNSSYGYIGFPTAEVVTTVKCRSRERGRHGIRTATVSPGRQAALEPDTHHWTALWVGLGADQIITIDRTTASSFFFIPHSSSLTLLEQGSLVHPLGRPSLIFTDPIYNRAHQGIPLPTSIPFDPNQRAVYQTVKNLILGPRCARQ